MHTDRRHSALVHRFSRTPPPLVPCSPTDKTPYNLDRLDDDRYRLTVPAAGFEPDDVDISLDGGQLLITATRRPTVPRGTRLHQGLPSMLEYRFMVLEPLGIVDTSLSDGLLIIDLEIDPLDPAIAAKPMTAFMQAQVDTVAA